MALCRARIEVALRALKSGEQPQLPLKSVTQSAWVRPAIAMFAMLSVAVWLPSLVVGSQRPNLIIISIDTLRADHVGAYGYPRPTTPTLDALAAGSVVFEQAFAHAPKTAISHMSLFTSLVPEAHGVEQWTKDGGTRLSEDIPTLATLFARSGYRTVAHTAGGAHAERTGVRPGLRVF